MYTADLRKGGIEHEVRICVRTRLEFFFDDFSICQRDGDHVFGLHAVVRHAAGFDDHDSARAIHAARVAPRFDDQSFTNQV